MVVMTITNIGLMYRLWISDFKIKAKSIDSKFLKEIKKWCVLNLGKNKREIFILIR